MPFTMNGAQSRCACAKAAYVPESRLFSSTQLPLMRVVVDPVRAVSRESIRMPGAASTYGPKLRALPVQPASSLFFSESRMFISFRAKRICRMNISRWRICAVVRRSSSDSCSQLRKVASRRRSRIRIQRTPSRLSRDRSKVAVLGSRLLHPFFCFHQARPKLIDQHHAILNCQV